MGFFKIWILSVADMFGDPGLSLGRSEWFATVLHARFARDSQASLIQEMYMYLRSSINLT